MLPLVSIEQSSTQIVCLWRSVQSETHALEEQPYFMTECGNPSRTNPTFGGSSELCSKVQASALGIETDQVCITDAYALGQLTLSTRSSTFCDCSTIISWWCWPFPAVLCFVSVPADLAQFLSFLIDCLHAIDTPSDAPVAVERRPSLDHF